MVESWWQFAAFSLNSVVFLLVGFQAVQLGELAGLWAPVTAAYLVVMGTRAVTVAITAAALRRTSEAVPFQWTKVLAWAGLRGPLSMVLALDLPDSVPEKHLVLDITSGVVVLSILLQGLTMPGFLRRAGVLGGDAGGGPPAGAATTATTSRGPPGNVGLPQPGGGAAAIWRPSNSARGVSSAFDRTLAEWMRARCENACGKLPSRRFRLGSYSSARSPRSFLSETSRSKRRSASLVRPE
jgi:hypothetical protein